MEDELLPSIHALVAMVQCILESYATHRSISVERGGSALEFSELNLHLFLLCSLT